MIQYCERAAAVPPLQCHDHGPSSTNDNSSSNSSSPTKMLASAIRFSLKYLRYLILHILQTAFNSLTIVVILYLIRWLTPTLSNQAIYLGREELVGKRAPSDAQLNTIRLEKARIYLAEGNLTRFKVRKCPRNINKRTGTFYIFSETIRIYKIRYWEKSSFIRMLCFM